MFKGGEATVSKEEQERSSAALKARADAARKDRPNPLGSSVDARKSQLLKQISEESDPVKKRSLREEYKGL
jgi:hypothetical protein